MDDATVAATYLTAVYEGIHVVLLHGSVARGDATADSDIDLLAVYADLDYDRRRNLGFEMEKRAAGSVPFPVQVHPTDLPEWHTRSTHVPCSFEANVAAGATVVVAEGAAHASSVVWQKEQELATDNLGASLDYPYSYVAPKLESLSELLIPDSRVISREKLYPQRRHNRMRRICENSSMAMEIAFKALTALRGEHPVAEKEMRKAGHNIGLCLGQLSRPYRIAMNGLLTSYGLGLSSLSSWRIRGDNEDNGYSAYERVDDYILAALSVTSAVISEFESAGSADDSRVTGTRREWRFAAEMYDTINPLSGEPRQAPLSVTSRLESLKLELTPGQLSLFDSPEI